MSAGILSSVGAALAAAALLMAAPAGAQRADENAVVAASDAFGTSVGVQTIGLYSPTSARGFNPTQAGNQWRRGFFLPQVPAGGSAPIMDPASRRRGRESPMRIEPMSNWTRDRNCFLSRHRIDPQKRDEFIDTVEKLLVFAKPYYDRGCAFAFQGWGRDPNEWVAIASWDEDVVQELRATDEFQRINAAMLDCCTGPVILEQFSGMKKDRSVFDRYPAGTSTVHRPGNIHELIFR